MNNEKAREFFSAYYDGTLEHGLRQSLEQKLRNDAVLASDYAAFTETMMELDSMRFEEIEVPIYLSDRIATRIEETSSNSRSYTPSWSVWFRGLAFGGLATAAIVLAVTASNTRSIGDVAVGNVVPSANINSDQLKFNYRDGAVLLQFSPSSPKTIVVSSGTTGKELRRFELSGKRLESSLENPLAETALFHVKVEGSSDQALVAIPGTARQAGAEGSGSVADLAMAIAEYYRVPVLVQAADPEKQVNWNFDGIVDPREAAGKALTDSFSVDRRQSGMLVIL